MAATSVLAAQVGAIDVIELEGGQVLAEVFTSVRSGAEMLLSVRVEGGDKQGWTLPADRPLMVRRFAA